MDKRNTYSTSHYHYNDCEDGKGLNMEEFPRTDLEGPWMMRHQWYRPYREQSVPMKKEYLSENIEIPESEENSGRSGCGCDRECHVKLCDKN